MSNMAWIYLESGTHPCIIAPHPSITLVSYITCSSWLRVLADGPFANWISGNFAFSPR